MSLGLRGSLGAAETRLARRSSVSQLAPGPAVGSSGRKRLALPGGQDHVKVRGPRGLSLFSAVEPHFAPVLLRYSVESASSRSKGRGGDTSGLVPGPRRVT